MALHTSYGHINNTENGTTHKLPSVNNSLIPSEKGVVLLLLLLPLLPFTPPLSTPLAPDNCRQIHMWRVRGLPNGKPTRRAVTTMGSNDLVVGEVHMLGSSCQRHNWHTGWCGSIAFGSSPRRGKTLISNPRCLAEVSTRGKDFRR